MTARVRCVRATERVPAAQQTPGMHREEAIATATLWSGVATTAPGATSGWHHHGGWDTVAHVLAGRVRLEWGPGGAEVVEAGPGDTLWIPGGVVHREGNPGEEVQRLFVVRTGAGPVLFAVEGPAPAA
jgi:uncharacterized RmlC-like cupin family protein